MLNLTKFEGHTPGPWSWFIEKDDDLFTTVILSTGNHPHYEAGTILECNSVVRECESKSPSISDTVLIAAAPDLLAEVKGLRIELTQRLNQLEESRKDTFFQLDKNKELHQQLGNLVCLLCQDGGHTISKVGMEAAIKQAETNYLDLRAENEKRL